MLLLVEVLGAGELVAEGHHIAKTGEKRAEDVPLRLELVRLAVVAERDFLLDDGGAAVGLDLLRDQTEEG